MNSNKNKFICDALVIGNGISGLLYSLELLKNNPECRIALICKKNLFTSNSYFARSGISAIGTKPDSLQQFLEDILKCGDGLSNKKIAKKILQHSQIAIKTLVNYGIIFDQNTSRAAGHTYPRLYHIKDYVGNMIIAPLVKKINNNPQITIFENHCAIDLITQNENELPTSAKEVIGAYIFDEKNNKVKTFLAKITVLASGGIGRLFSYTTNIKESTGDGYAMAYRAGCKLMNMEFLQFHPTFFYNENERKRFLIPEVVRSQGAVLVNADTKKKFMYKYDPINQELATRDTAARAIFQEIAESEKPFVYLDARLINKDILQNKLSHTYKLLLSHGIDMSKDMIPIIPAAHYSCGGIAAEISGKTDIKRLYAIGEVAYTGLHGANRLPGNSLMESSVMAILAAKNSRGLIIKDLAFSKKIKPWKNNRKAHIKNLNKIRINFLNIRNEIFSYVGIVRNPDSLGIFFKMLNIYKEMLQQYWANSILSVPLIEFRNVVMIAKILVYSALERKESRGVHYDEKNPKKSSVNKDTILRSDKI